ncbi:MAG: hypothetical protein ACK559_42095, partial [bacterium]
MVDLDPGMAGYVDAKGRMIVKWDYMIYGDKKAGRLWYDEIVGVYTKMGFTINKVDPCLLHYESAKGTIHCALTVDDALLVYS